MESQKVIIVIPARYESSRFPGKPLALIAGESMISRVWKRCCQALSASQVYVATDNERIRAHCEDLGIQVVMTSSNCLTGTDRVYEVSQKIKADIYINVQGDEPLIEPDDIQTVIEKAKQNPSNIINAMCPIQSESDFYSSSVPKVVARPDGRLLYMSRANIPTDKKLNFVSAKKQVCIYAFNQQSLVDFASVDSKTPLEQIEDIEILRFLELGYEVNMVDVSSASIAVDFPEDVERVEGELNVRS